MHLLAKVCCVCQDTHGKGDTQFHKQSEAELKMFVEVRQGTRALRLEQIMIKHEVFGRVWRLAKDAHA